MIRHADLPELHHQIFRDAIVEDALALEHGLLLRIERGRVVLEVLDESARLGSLIEDLRLALVNELAAFHGSKSELFVTRNASLRPPPQKAERPWSSRMTVPRALCKISAAE